MKKDLQQIIDVIRSKKYLHETKNILSIEQNKGFTFNFKSSIETKSKKNEKPDIYLVYVGDDSIFMDEVCMSFLNSSFEKYTPILFLGHKFSQGALDQLLEKFKLVDFILLPSPSEIIFFKIHQLTGFRKQLIDGIKFGNGVESQLQLDRSKDIQNIEHEVKYLRKLLSDRTMQLVKEINENIQSRFELNNVATDLNSNPGLFDSLLEVIPDPIFFKNNKGIYIGCNKAFEILVDQKRADIIGKSAYDFLIPEYAEIVSSRDHQAIIRNTPGFDEERALFKNGSEMQIVVYRSAFTIDKSKNEQGSIGIIVDISQKQNTEKLIHIQNDIDNFSYAEVGLKESMAYVLKKLIEINWIDCGGIYLFNDTKKDLGLISHIGLSKEFIDNNQIYDENSSQVKFIEQSKSYYGNYNDLIELTNSNQNNERLEAIAILPLIRSGKVIGAINLASKSAKVIPETDKIVIHSIAAKTAIVLGYLKSREEVEKAKLLLESKVKIRTKELDEANKKLQREIEFHKSTKDSLSYSENLYRTIFDNAQDSIVLYDAKTFKLVDFNPNTYLDLGYTRDEFLNLNIDDFTIYDSNTQREIVLTQLFRDKKVVYEVKHKTKTARIRNRIISANLVEVHGKRYILGIVHDITRLSQAKYYLKLKNERIKALRENVSVGLIRINKQGFFIYANSYVAYLTGEKNKEIVIGKNISSYIADAEMFKALTTQIEKNREVNDFELKIKRIDNSYIWIKVNAKGIANKYGIVHYYDGSVENITEIKNVQIKLQTANSKIKTINKNLKQKIEKAVLHEKLQQTFIIQKSKLESLGELASGIAHEINQPLGIMSLTFENLQSKLVAGTISEEYASKKIKSIAANIERIREIINHIRIFSRDQESIVVEKVDINEVIIDILKLIKTQFQNNSINIHPNLGESLGFTIGRKIKLEQVLLNLLSNAKHALQDSVLYGKPPTYHKTITIETTLVKKRICLKIEDNGAGIDPEYIGKIFDPFFTTKPEWVGTGLGLSIVYGIIKEMKGNITVKSKLGKYTVFKIYFPGYPGK